MSAVAPHHGGFRLERPGNKPHLDPTRGVQSPPASKRAMMAAPQLLGILLLLGIANGSPVLAARLLRYRFDVPLDGGRRLPDGQPVFGSSKTIRGLVVSIGSTTIAALLLGFE